MNLVACHLGSGISVVAMRKGRMIDVNNAASQGPFSPERTGGLPLIEMLDFMIEEGHDPGRMKVIILREGGLSSYLGTNDLRSVTDRIADGDDRAREIVEAMAYQIAKEIGGMAATLAGRVDAVVLTGAMAQSDYLVALVRERVSFLGEIIVLPGENELESLAMGALEVLLGGEEPRTYPTG